MKIKLCILVTWCGILVSCTPKIYLIDRQTVLEQEASGNWPELDKVFYAESMKPGPTELPQTGDDKNTKALDMTRSDQVKKNQLPKK